MSGLSLFGRGCVGRLGSPAIQLREFAPVFGLLFTVRNQEAQSLTPGRILGPWNSGWMGIVFAQFLLITCLLSSTSARLQIAPLR